MNSTLGAAAPAPPAVSASPAASPAVALVHISEVLLEVRTKYRRAGDPPPLPSPPVETYSQLAMQSRLALDRTFRALSDGTRRAMIETLARGGGCSAGELGCRFNSAQPTISKHLKVLEEAGLVARRVDGRVHRFRLRRKPLQEAENWLARHQAFWTGAVDQLDRLLADGGGDAP